MKRMATAGIASLFLLAAIAAAPASQPTTRPVKPITSLEQIPKMIPNSVKPQPGEEWQTINYQLLDDWVRKTLPGRRVLLNVWLMDSGLKKNANGDTLAVWARFDYVLESDSEGVHPGSFNVDGVKWSAIMQAQFLTSDEAVFSKLKARLPYSKQRGSHLLVGGQISAFTISLGPTKIGSMDIALTDCKIVSR